VKRALVLGGGGNVGIAWEIGVVAALLDGGVDVRGADLIVGTSAGSVVGTHLAHGRDARELTQQRREQDTAPLENVEPDREAVSAIFRFWQAETTMTQARCAEIGRMALAAPTMPEERFVQGFERHGWPGWPDKPLLITAVDCESGAFRVFDRTSDVPIERACAASCSVPGLFPPVSINGRRYTDGGVASGTSADLAQRIEPDIVLILAPMGTLGGPYHELMAAHIAREKGALESAGATICVLQLDEQARAAIGGVLMDPSKAPAGLEAGVRQGREAALRIAGWWSG
jgi:NTE family protein